MKFYIGQKFGNNKGVRINVLDVSGDYVVTECYNVNDTSDKNEGLHVAKLVEEHLKEFGFEEIK